MTRKIDYLFLRKGSRNWQLKLQSPRIEKSLGTPDRAQAEILALPYIQEHKVRLLEAKPGVQVTWLHRFAPGQEHITPDGERIVADDRELIFLNHNGAIVRKEPNGEFAVALAPLREQKAIVRREEQRQRTATSPDDALIETYLKHKNITGYYEREARAVWALYKQLTNGKPLKDASRDDGRKLVDYYEKQNLKSATIQKKIGWLTAAVNLARKAVSHLQKIEVEVENFSQLHEALAAGADTILLDNMTPEQTREAVRLVRETPGGQHLLLESSGGITLQTVHLYAEAGVDLISVGALTHSAPAVDISLEMTAED